MNPSSAIALVSAMPGLCCSVFSALEMVSLLAAQQTSKTATPATAIAPRCNICLVFFIGPIECSSSPTARSRATICTLPNRLEGRQLDLGTMLWMSPERSRDGVERDSGADNLPHLTGVIRAQLADFARKAPRVQRVEHRLDRRRFDLRLHDDEIVAFVAIRDEVQAEGVCTESDGDSHIGQTRRDCRGDVEMAARFDLVSCNAIWLEVLIGQRFVEGRTRSGASFAVHDPEAGSCKVGETANRQRIAGRHREPDFPARKVNNYRAATAQRAADWCEVVLATLLIAQMNTGDMRPPIDQVAQRSLARARDRNRVNRGLPPRQPVRQDCYRGIASRHQNRRIDFIRQSKGADVHAMAPRGTLHQAGRRREHETRCRLRYGNDFSADAREHDPRLRACCTTRLAVEPARIDQRWGLVVDFAEQRLDAAA